MIGLLKMYFLHYVQDLFRIRIRPRTLQMPITSKCNSRCLTCNIWKHKERNDINEKELRNILKRPFFSKVRSVGINGGEPFLHANIVGVVKAVLSLRKLRHITIISNCILETRVLENLSEIHTLCKKGNVKLHLQISIDGIDDVHDSVRGIKKSFEHSLNVINEIRRNKGKYVDDFNLGFTISKYNVDYIIQTEEFFEDTGIPIYFHLAVPNKRIHNFENAAFSVLTDKHATQMAKEFFLIQSIKAKKRIEKIRYYLTYLYLAGKTNRRLFICDYLYQDITINEKLDTFLCATASEKVGSLLDGIPSYKDYNKFAKETKEHCNQCIHYGNIPTIGGILTYIKHKFTTYKWVSKYKNSI